ncbi:2-oxoglutarate-dependent dioxygenase DAO-like isoform X2 [Euphorbia lathyris]|uniref:2-oxoglutarate-dependent dioxygenase DAO-like isoform X2 n=1 Tax=Euphorbia lathyris TaxID=212925 RepID=UPI0033142E9A
MHTDSGFLTIFQDDENFGGLEVMDKSGEFVAVNPQDGTLLVNLGDSVVHRSLALADNLGEVSGIAQLGCTYIYG